jgi:hypothetical protein
MIAGFIIGLFVGVLLGVVTIGLFAASRCDRCIEDAIMRERIRMAKLRGEI